MENYGWADFIRQKEQARSAVRKSFQLTADRLTRIKSYENTRRVKYPEYKEAFDYVHELYPFAGVKQAFVYHTPKYFLNEVGYGGVGGFYDTYAKVVVITDWLGDDESHNPKKVQAKFTIDEVLCHELIHYCANYKLAVSSRNVEEEIAYGKSIGYLRLKGHSDDFIIEKNMMPYLMTAINKGDVYRHVLLKHFDPDLLAKASTETLEKLLEPLGDEIFRAMKDSAYKLGEQMLSAYGGVETKVKAAGRRNLIIDDFDV